MQVLNSNAETVIDAAGKSKDKQRLNNKNIDDSVEVNLDPRRNRNRFEREVVFVADWR